MSVIHEYDIISSDTTEGEYYCHGQRSKFRSVDRLAAHLQKAGWIELCDLSDDHIPEDLGKDASDLDITGSILDEPDRVFIRFTEDRYGFDWQYCGFSAS